MREITGALRYVIVLPIKSDSTATTDARYRDHPLTTFSRINEWTDITLTFRGRRLVYQNVNFQNFGSAQDMYNQFTQITRLSDRTKVNFLQHYCG